MGTAITTAHGLTTQNGVKSTLIVLTISTWSIQKSTIKQTRETTQLATLISIYTNRVRLMWLSARSNHLQQAPTIWLLTLTIRVSSQGRALTPRARPRGQNPPNFRFLQKFVFLTHGSTLG